MSGTAGQNRAKSLENGHKFMSRLPFARLLHIFVQIEERDLQIELIK